jgi:hypothetical protein
VQEAQNSRRTIELCRKKIFRKIQRERKAP